MDWLELTVAVDQEAVESISELLVQYGYNGGVTVEATPPPDARPDEAGLPLPLGIDPHYPVVVRTYLPQDEQAAVICRQIEQALWHLGQLRPVGPLQVKALTEEDWANSWKQYYNIQRIGAHTVIVPSWLDYAPQPEDVVLQLDPGMAFGTGLHPTTQLCLMLLEQQIHAGNRVLDLGTGSGILAIAAAKQGAGSVLALDNDPLAIEVARENIALNGVADQVTVDLYTAPPSDLATTLTTPPYELLCVNIIADVLLEFAPAFPACLTPEGRLLSSGIILERETEVLLSYAAAGLVLVERHLQGAWVALVHTPR